ncbi:hypothetical protein DICVIV_10210 [Dictyocaulus viviparus]|uniref:Uncharacterized protein n=1 Tax=Dictyocaulus viviparus TaxID=29172 RepID=A0A0D8XN43_DICVI|nr:hypothetical protein DICVIV_10210 [Dictyocaulus viviparus]
MTINKLDELESTKRVKNTLKIIYSTRRSRTSHEPERNTRDQHGIDRILYLTQVHHFFLAHQTKYTTFTDKRMVKVMVVMNGVEITKADGVCMRLDENGAQQHSRKIDRAQQHVRESIDTNLIDRRIDSGLLYCLGWSLKMSFYFDT